MISFFRYHRYDTNIQWVYLYTLRRTKDGKETIDYFVDETQISNVPISNEQVSGGGSRKTKRTNFKINITRFLINI